uniref:CARD domain-containing protein n=1 Tax=Acanthochromis polyacanthus TaxID=80966 RepID=A0A3Q1EE76_9TELE
MSAEDWLLSVRRRLINGLSDVTVNQLLDRLYDQNVTSEEEKDVIRAQTGADKARQLIDRIHRKGPDAVSCLKTALRLSYTASSVNCQFGLLVFSLSPQKES